MASSYRPTGTSRRQNRAAHDHDVFEGLPVRRWTRSWVSVGKPATLSSQPQPELPLPKDTSLLSATSQALLAAARSGSDTPVPQAPKPDYTAGEKLFVTKKWCLIPKSDESAEETYLITLPGGKRKEPEEEETGQVKKRVGPPVGRKKLKGNRGRKKKVVEVKDVEMVDVDAATKEEEVVVGEVGREVERQEEAVEKAALESSREGEKRHDIPIEATPGDVVEEMKEAGQKMVEEEAVTPAPPA